MSEHQAQVEEYQTVREALTTLSEKVMPGLTRKIIRQVRKKLHVNRIAFDQAEISTVELVMIDYALYHARPGGQTLFEAYFERHPPAPESPLARLREAMSRYRYTLLEIDAVEPDVGVELYDHIYDETYFLIDRNLSQTSREGLVVASGLISLPDYAMTTGAMLTVSLPVCSRLLDDIDATFGPLEDLQYGDLSQARANRLAARIIQEALRDDLAPPVGYR